MIINKFLSHSVITPGEFLIRAGEVPQSMYFVISGEFKILDGNGLQIAELMEGSVVGEVSVLLKRNAYRDVQASSTCDVFGITVEDFQQINHVFPSFRAKLVKRAERREND